MASKEQAAIIEAPTDRHIKIVAVAGSGKSTTIRERVIHLIRNGGIDPRRILILMFNKSAQVEFTAKLSAINLGGQMPSTRTYHSLGARLCQSLTEKGFLAKACLSDETAKWQAMGFARSALKSVVGSTSIKGLQPDSPAAQTAFLEFIDLVKSSSVGPAQSFIDSGIDTQFEPWVKAFFAFEEARKEAGVRFFSDLIYDPVMMLSNNPSAREFISNKLSQILVDEYQDINDISQELIRLISGDTAKVTVVGDDDQTIYEFRGSRPIYLINRFEESFPNPLVFTLSRTYRYGHLISLIANNVIQHNRERFPKLCISNESTSPASVRLFQSPHGGGSFSDAINGIVAPIKEYQKLGFQLSDCAILLRVFANSPAIELGLLSNGVPYVLEGANNLLQRDPFKSLLGMIDACIDIKEGEFQSAIHALTPHLINFPKLAIKRDKLDHLTSLLMGGGFDKSSFFNAITDGLSKTARDRVLDRLNAIEWASKNTSLSPAQFVAGYLDKSNAREIIKKFTFDEDEGDEELKSLDAFLDFLRESNCKTPIDLRRFLSDYKTLRNASTSCVRITTVHRAKGLEWPIVILPRLSETRFPHLRKNQRPDIQSERRLFYVAITRATRYLILIVPIDELLERAIAKKQANVPISILNDGSRASRFVYESNIAPSVQLAKDIHGSKSYTALEELDEPEPFNTYLRAIDSEMLIAKSRYRRN